MSCKENTSAYHALPGGIVLKPSSIHGYGIYTEIDLPKDLSIGVSHVLNSSGLFHNDLIRTPLGGYLNHSSTPNCILHTADGVITFLVTDTLIKPNEELTIDYRLFECGSYYIDQWG